MSATGYRDVTLFRRLFGQARPHLPLVAVCLMMSLLSVPLALLTPLPLKIAVDSVIGSRPLPGILDQLLPALIRQSRIFLLILAASLVVIFALLDRGVQLATSVLQAQTSEKLLLDFRSRLFDRAQRLSLSFHESRGAADSLYRIQNDALSIQYVAVENVIAVVTAAFTLTCLIYVTTRIDWQLAAVGLAVSPVLFLVTRTYRRRLRSQSREAKRLESGATATAQEALSSLRVVKAFGRENYEAQRFRARSREGMNARIRLAWLEGIFGLLTGAIPAVGSASVLLIGIDHVQAGILTLGDFLLVVSYLAKLFEPLKTLSKKVASLQAHLASAERAFSLLDAPDEVAERRDARPLYRASGSVSFRSVCFSYGKDRPVLEAISFDVGAGSRVGIMGATGAGKSTVINLLIRFYDPTSGQILLDGIDIRELRLADLRRQFAIVLQDPVLFSATIAENIAYGRPDARPGEITAAAKLANAHDFVARLPRGYETPVGERGMLLSGGERQRISLARAFLKDAPILILDEPTSAVDVDTESVILEAMERLMLDRTTFLISHRLNVFDDCDVLLRLERGSLVEEARPARSGWMERLDGCTVEAATLGGKKHG